MWCVVWDALNGGGCHGTMSRLCKWSALFYEEEERGSERERGREREREREKDRRVDSLNFEVSCMKEEEGPMFVCKHSYTHRDLFC